MNATQRALEDSVKGGWEAWGHCTESCPEKAWFEISMDGKSMIAHEDTTFADNAHDQVIYPISDALLDPSFWRALGKERGWGENCTVCNSKANGLCSAHKYSTWNGNMHGLIDALASGSSIEEYFISLEK